MFPCLDWEKRLAEKRSLLPDDIVANINWPMANKALEILNNLVIPDVPQIYNRETDRYENLYFGTDSGQWAKDLLIAVIGSFTPEGVRFCREFFVLVPKKNAKALALDTLVPTLRGMIPISDIQIGDKVFGVDGEPVNVVGKSEVFTGRKCYEVCFSTGEKIVCDAEHLWVTDAHKDRENSRSKTGDRYPYPIPTVKTTEEIANSVVAYSGKYRINNHRLKIPSAVRYPEQELPIPPYTLGVWLGDGSAKGRKLFLNGEDADEILGYIREEDTPFYILKRHTDVNLVDVSLSRNGKEEARGVGFEPWQDLIDNKHIPEIYLRASFFQRLNLLQGLLDTDAHITRHKWPQVVFTSSIERLAYNVKELANSLGLKTTLKVYQSFCNGKRCKDSYSLTIYNSDYPLFKLRRKAERQRYGKLKMEKRSMYRQIVAVNEVTSVPTQCISVDSEDGQFQVTRDYIPTHNTSIGAAIMLVVILLNKRPNAEFVIVSPSISVSHLAFGQLRGMIAHDPILNRMFHCQDTLNKVLHKKTKAFIKIKSMLPRVATGAKPAGILIDELHVIGEMPHGRRVMGQLRGGMISQAEAFMIIITTQSENVPMGIFAEELIKARGVRDGKMQIPLCPLLYEFPPTIDWRDDKYWYMVNPNDGYSLNVSRLKEEFAIAIATGEGEVRRWASQHLNIEIGSALTTDSWPGAYFWDENSEKIITPAYIIDNCDKIIIGIDGGGLNDMLGLCILGRIDNELGDPSKWVAWFKAWLHPIAVENQRDKRAVSAYIDFCLDGDLEIDSNIGTDIIQLCEIAKEAEAFGRLEKVGVDPVGIGAIIDSLVAAGIPESKIVAVPQGYRLNGAIKTTERKLAEGTLKHAPSRLMQYCVTNAKVEVKGSATYVTKGASGSGKIDPLMALFNAVAILSMVPEKKTDVADWIA